MNISDGLSYDVSKLSNNQIVTLSFCLSFSHKTARERLGGGGGGGGSEYHTEPIDFFRSVLARVATETYYKFATR